jgi:hypothetical protein
VYPTKLESVPTAVLVYRSYCLLAALLNFVVAAGAVWLIVDRHRLASEYVPAEAWALAGWMFLPTGIGFGLLNVWLFRVRRRGQEWAMHLGNIVLGVASCCLTPVCLPLMLAWLRPEVKEWFSSA